MLFSDISSHSFEQELSSIVSRYWTDPDDKVINLYGSKGKVKLCLFGVLPGTIEASYLIEFSPGPDLSK